MRVRPDLDQDVDAGYTDGHLANRDDHVRPFLRLELRQAQPDKRRLHAGLQTVNPDSLLKSRRHTSTWIAACRYSAVSTSIL